MNVLERANRLLYSRRETAKLLGISLRSVDHLLANDRLRSVRVGGRRLISRDHLENFAGTGIRERIVNL